ncbi:MAG: flagellar basal body-associated FliL family protein [Helicobacteraceae bacterium]|nr:flagellar basal body-associated FliL family protein [Helicobacteraceae bacterium]
MAEEKEDGKVEPQKKSPVLLIVIGAAAFFLIVVIVIVVILIGGSGSKVDSGDIRASPGASSEAEVTLGPIVELEQFVVNLLSNDGRRFLKVKISFEVTSKGGLQEIENKKTLVRDLAIDLLSGKRFDEISTASGKVRLREELRNSINRYLRDTQIKRVFFTDFVIQ